MNRNRRGRKFIDPQMTVLRLDKADGSPYAVLVNYTAHGTFVNEHDMLISGEWAGSMQRTVEDLIGGGVICLYTNGAEGDISPEGRWIGFSGWTSAAGLPQGDFENLVIPVRVGGLMGCVVGPDGLGGDALYFNFNQVSGKLFLVQVDPAGGRARQFDAPEGPGAWAFVVGPDERIYRAPGTAA